MVIALVKALVIALSIALVMALDGIWIALDFKTDLSIAKKNLGMSEEMLTFAVQFAHVA